MEHTKLNVFYDQLKPIIDALPSLPGIYQYLNENDTIIYIGKAKNLKKRVSSYFNKIPDSAKTRVLVRCIRKIQHLVVETEEDALLLENNLIKKYQPKYNVLLKDDKSFPWICIKNEDFPKVFLTRNVIKDGSQYFGPYTSVRMVRVLLDLINQIYKLRSCNLILTDQNIQTQKYKVCLEFHIGNCKAPCIGMQSSSEYDSYIDQIRKILKGNINSVTKFLSESMISLANEFRFEEAQELKVKIELLENYKAKSTIVNASINNVDVFSIINDNNTAYVNYVKVMDGAIIQSFTVEIKKKVDEDLTDLLLYAITNIREKVNSESCEIIIPFEVDFNFKNIKITVPKIGDKKKLLELSERNAKYFRLEKLKQFENKNPGMATERILTRLKEDLNLSVMPVHIECFDNSNLQGTNPVASCVVFRNGKPSKKDYRHFTIKTVEGPNDFASMEEIISRRYKRLLDEKLDLPNLIIIDGGKGQLSSALKSLQQLGLENRIAVIGIAKKLEEIYFRNDSVPLYLDKNSESLKLIQQLRNEAHRFGIVFHRNKRSKNFIKSEIDNIAGIGDKTKSQLLSEFKSVAKIKSATIVQLSTVIGKSKATIVFNYFNSNTQS